MYQLDLYDILFFVKSFQNPIPQVLKSGTMLAFASSPLDHPLVTNCNMYFLPPANKAISISIDSQEYLYQLWTWTNHSLESNHIVRTFSGITSQKNSILMILILLISFAHIPSAQKIHVHPISAPLTFVSFIIMLCIANFSFNHHC